MYNFIVYLSLYALYIYILYIHYIYIDVRVGSMNDPEHAQGLAHFLERKY